MKSQRLLADRIKLSNFEMWVVNETKDFLLGRTKDGNANPRSNIINSADYSGPRLFEIMEGSFDIGYTPIGNWSIAFVSIGKESEFESSDVVTDIEGFVKVGLHSERLCPPPLRFFKIINRIDYRS